MANTLAMTYLLLVVCHIQNFHNETFSTLIHRKSLTARGVHTHTSISGRFFALFSVHVCEKLLNYHAIYDVFST